MVLANDISHSAPRRDLFGGLASLKTRVIGPKSTESPPRNNPSDSVPLEHFRDVTKWNRILAVEGIPETRDAQNNSEQKEKPSARSLSAGNLSIDHAVTKQ